MPSESVFVDFFGKAASTSTGIARLARRTGAAVVPGYAVWDEPLGRYRLRFEPPVELTRTGDEESDILANTQKFAKVDRKSTRLNSSHPSISYAVFCLKKKKSD